MNEDHLNRLRSMAEKYGGLLAKQKGVFLCLSNPESKLAWERIHAVSEMISSLSHS